MRSAMQPTTRSFTAEFIRFAEEALRKLRCIGGQLERHRLPLRNAADVEPLSGAGSEQLVSDGSGATVFGRVAAAGHDNVDRVRHV